MSPQGHSQVVGALYCKISRAARRNLKKPEETDSPEKQRKLSLYVMMAMCVGIFMCMVNREVMIQGRIIWERHLAYINLDLVSQGVGRTNCQA